MSVIRLLEPLSSCKICLAILCGASLALFTPSAFAIEHNTLDSQHSHAGFQIKAMWLFNVGGQLGAIRGTVSIDAFHNTAKVDARIDANEIRMHNPEYAGRVKSVEFFDVQHYPEIHFISEPTPLPRLRYGGELRGTLELRGIRQPTVFELIPSVCQGRLRHDCAVRAVGTIQRSAFGMTTRHLTLSDKVELDFAIFINEIPVMTDTSAPR